MEYKDILQKIKTEIPKQDQQKAIRAAASAMNGGSDPSVVWSDLLEKYSPEKSAAQSATKNPEKKRKNTKSGQRKASKPEKVSGDIIGGGLSPVTDAGDLDMAEIEKRILQALEDFQRLYNIEDMTKAPQRQWSAASTYIGQHVFKGTKILKDTTKKDTASATLTTCNAYDIKKVAAVLNLYMYLCNIYDKVFFYDAGAEFCGTNYHFISMHIDELTAAGFDASQKGEQSLVSGIVDGKRSPIGSTVVLNHRYGYAQAAPQAPAQNITVVAYPVLGSSAPVMALDDKKERV